MNIFVLDECPVISAQMQCDKHVVKMIVESAQMLSTAHRMLDGIVQLAPSKSGKRMVKHYRLFEDPEYDRVIYKAVHFNHPCSVWVRESTDNYKWLYNHFVALCDEYTYRYGKTHKTDSVLRPPLWTLPTNIKKRGLTEFALAMKANPECIFYGKPIKSYRAYYQTKQDRFKMVWTKRERPEWFEERVYA